MAQKSASKRSKLGLERHHPGCIGSLLHFALFQGSWQQRLHLKKMIAYKRHADTSRHPRIKVPKVQHCFIKEGSKLHVEEVEESKLRSPSKSPTKSPTKSPKRDLLRTLKFKKKLTEKGHRRCMSSLPPSMATRLVRTVSMHHLKDCNYVLPNGTSDNKKATNEGGVLHSSGAPPISNFVKNESKKACQQCGSVSGLNLVDQIHQSKDLLDFLQFFSENKNLLMNIARNPQILLVKEPLEKQMSSDEGISSGLNKSQSFPRAGMPQNIEPHMPSSTPNNSKAIRSNIKNSIKENKKEFLHISNDSIFHKVPFGQKDQEGHRRNYRKEGGGTQMRRSASLVESLDKYSNLFGRISRDETKIMDCVPGLPEMRSDSAFKRIHSSPEIKLYSAFVPPSISTSSRDIRDTKSVQSFSDDEPLDSVFGVEPTMCTMEDAELLHPHLCPSQVEKLDPDSHDYEGMQPNLETERIYDSPFSDENTSAINLKHSLSDLKVPNLEENQNQVQVVDRDSIEVDESDEAYFHYMKDILVKSGLMGTEWHSSEQPALDPALLELEPDSSPEQLLLFDLVNEALLDAYEASLLPGTWVPQCGFGTRPLHLGVYMVEEVWARLKRQLNSFVEVATEDVVAADFQKNMDGWMVLNLEREFVGLDLEDWITEDLVHEIVLEIAESPINPSF